MNTALEHKIGQMIILGFQGSGPGHPAGIEHILKLAAQGRIGGVILYGYNIVDPDQLQTITGQLKSVETEYPLFIFIDQEGGNVQRLNRRKGFRDFHSAKHIATHLTPAQAREYYRKMGILLKNTGFNFNFAPCVDLNFNLRCEVIGGLDRSYSDSSSVVTDYAEAMIDGLRDSGICSCIKHYPGHGNAVGDSHQGMVDISETWQPDELTPYRHLIAKKKVDAVMTAHIVHQHVDPDTPATFSPIWLARLRQELAFNGLIISDDLHMGAILQNYDLEEAVIRGIQAGLDMIMFSNNPFAALGVEGFQADPEVAEKTIQAVLKAIVKGKIFEEKIESAYQRILCLKESV